MPLPSLRRAAAPAGRRPRLRQALLVSLLALSQVLAPTPARAQGLPGLGDAVDMGVGAERRLGDSIARELYRDPDYLEDPVLDGYVDAIWQKLLAAARTRGELTPELEERFAWELMIGRDRSVNAFALPGGYFGLHTGLIAITGSRDELASVLGHELSHVTQRHIARIMTTQNRQTPMLLAAMILGALAASKSGRSSGDLGQAMIMGGQAMAMQKQLDFSRDMEREADRIGYGVMTQAGFAPQGAALMFERLQHASRLNDNGSYPYLRSHPLNSERITDMQARFQFRADAPRGGLPLRADHAMMAARARVLGRPGVDALRAWVRAAEAGDLAQQSAGARAGTLYAAAFSAAQLNDLPAARTAAARLRESTRDDAEAARLARLLSVEIELMGRNPQAAQALLAPPPGAEPDRSRAHLLLAAQVAQATGQPGPLIPALRDWVAVRPKDATAWRALAGLYHAANDPLRAIRAEAEANVAILDYVGARDRFKAAQDLVRNNAGGRGPVPIDHYEASIIDTRARENEVKVKEQAEELRQQERG
ncbi:M48 family metalloprotease [Xenophilus sp. Marseille-Q4582]|uniref:M48 family metalloprotease n=1 Tax=Xenophilus sp. Marseille-Q4582 TaxID=2866600 RepID=UPI001CE470C7|nr:M48 family metalloprotease [Xenophilus sp. Marseille-Q4582]